ncbi:Lrp/AsnC family transcriptional regulator [Actinomadura bangladeshensis]|uniref:Lrp/AsnC family transcriptional regulator n=1 Tax=Actinomadura bangladeshensis TaxID=453573 RepID=A0A4R4P729_9ACTN|nr:Lrp/AsnC family transcriptional regulator [Actinomadura bangladeshensis]
MPTNLGIRLQGAQEWLELLHNLYSDSRNPPVFLYIVTTITGGVVAIDDLDARLIEMFAAEPRVGVLEASRRLGVARGTVQARLDRLARDGVVAGFGPEIDPAALGYGVTAFVTLQLRQAGGHDPVAARLAQVPEVIEAHTITGPGDMLCRVVARSNTDLQRVIDVLVDVAGVERASSVISLANQIPYRTLPLVRAATGTRERNREK